MANGSNIGLRSEHSVEGGGETGWSERERERERGAGARERERERGGEGGGRWAETEKPRNRMYRDRLGKRKMEREMERKR